MTNMKFDDLTVQKNAEFFAILDQTKQATTFGYGSAENAKASIDFIQSLGYRPFGFWRVAPVYRSSDDYAFRRNNNGELRIYRKDVP